MRHHTGPARDLSLIYVRPGRGARGGWWTRRLQAQKTRGIPDEVPLKCLFQKSLEIHIDEVQIVWPGGEGGSRLLCIAL